MSQLYYTPKESTNASRRIAILVADGFSAAETQICPSGCSVTAGALSFIIGPRRGKIYPAEQPFGGVEGIMADHPYEGQRGPLCLMRF